MSSQTFAFKIFRHAGTNKLKARTLEGVLKLYLEGVTADEGYELVYLTEMGSEN